MDRRQVWRVLVGLSMALAASACGSSAPGGVTPPIPGGGGDGNTVTVRNNSFAAAMITVATGTTVVWSWSAGDVNHNVTFDDGVHSSTQSSGSYSRMFVTAGTYQYRCTIHAPGMAGTVVVQHA